MVATSVEELTKGITVDGVAATTAELYLWTKADYDAKVKEINEGEGTAEEKAAALLTALADNGKKDDGAKLQNSNVGDYVIHVVASTADKEGTADVAVSIKAIPSATVKSWIKAEGTTFAADGKAHKPEITVTPDAEVYALNAPAFAVKFVPADSSSPAVTDQTNGPTAAGNYTVTATIAKDPTEGTANMEGASASFNFSISSAKTDFVVVGETAQNVDYNGSGDKLLSAYANELLATLTVKNANGGDSVSYTHLSALICSCTASKKPEAKGGRAPFHTAASRSSRPSGQGRWHISSRCSTPAGMGLTHI